MQRNNSIIIILLLIIIVILGYIAFSRKEVTPEHIPTPISYKEEQEPNIQPTNPYPEFIGDLIKTIKTGQITKFTYNGNIYYSVVTSFAIGSGLTIYTENGNKFGNCNASTGPQYDHEYCHNWTNIIEIWSKNKPTWMQ